MKTYFPGSQKSSICAVWTAPWVTETTAKNNAFWAPEKSVFVVFRRQGTPKADPYVRAEGPPLEKPATPSAVPWLAGFDAGKENRLRAWENGSHILHHLPARSGLIWARWR